MLIASLALALAATPADTSHARTRPDAQDAPSVTVHRQPALPTVALRLSILADDPPGYSGAGHLIQHLLLPSLEDQAARVGARVQAIRGADAIVYTVVGPATELDYLAGILRSALRAPQGGTAEMLSAQGALAGERSAERETAPQYVRAALRAQLFPGELPAAGTEDAAQRLSTTPLDQVWAEIYRPGRVSIVAVGDVELASVQRAFRGLPAAPATGLDPLPQDTVPSLAADTPQATRAWIGAAWSAGDQEPAAVSVTARLLRAYLRRRMTRSSVDVEHWWTHQGQAVALVVATPDSLTGAARRTVDGALTTLQGNLDERAVRDAAASVRRDLLFFSRSPERMAELLGEFADRGTGTDAAQRYYAALDTVTADDVRRVIDALKAADPATVFVPPQKIPASQLRL
ncbi:MAG: insulinase family protein [Gemmatimonadetes bacterium]|nr:insulinase family protein [Gemmatimonadota bacterium]